MMSNLTWDLSQLVESTDPEWISSRLEEMVKEAGGFHQKYQGEVESLDAHGLRALLEERDNLAIKFEGPVQYCSLLYSMDSTDPLAKRLNEAKRNTRTRAAQQMAFLDIDLAKLVSTRPELQEERSLQEYRHLLERINRAAPYVLSEKEERLIMVKDQNGIDSWYQLQGDWLSTRTFRIEMDGQDKELPYGQIIGLYQSPDRELRRRANSIVYSNLGKDDIVWSSALRAVCSDHLQMCEWRHYPTPAAPSLIENDLEQDSIDALMITIEKNVEVYRRYLRLKARIMGLDKLGNWDIMAPLPHAPERSYSWEGSQDLVIASFSGFDRQFGEWARGMFERRQVDGETRKGKVSGAFSSTWYNGQSAFVLQSFNGRLGDVYTQAHELGHAIHDHLGTRAQKPSNLEISACIAECGSIFGELLLTDHLLKEVKTAEERQSVIAAELDGFGQAAFQVSARYFFEWSLYRAIEEGKSLDGDAISSLWVAARDRIYGDSVDWLPEMRWEWTMKLHYYIPNFRFYNYPYVFAQLFVFALYKLYKEEGKAFVPKMKSLLSAGSSESPRHLASRLGFDITREEFWEKGISQAKEFIDRLENSMYEISDGH